MDEGDSSVPSKAWTLEDLRNASTNWNLDGDRALLNILESVHNNIVARTQNTASKLHSLNTELCRTSVSLKNVNNRFMGLSNIQFVESCVQEDDLEIIKDVQQNKDELIVNPQLAPAKGKDPEGKEAERREALLQRVSQSCGVLEGQCERLDISPDSDSESDSSPEDTAQSIVLRPKDIYSETPLPYIIGSHKWQKKWHIGLHDCSSESDSDDDTKLKPAEEARYSSSEESQPEQHVERSRDERVAERKSQMSLPIPNQKQTSDGNRSSMTSTSTNNSSDAIDQEVAKINSNLKTPLDGEGSQENLDGVDGGQKKVPKVIPNASDFAAELARKLGGNVHSTSNVASATKSNSGKSSGRPGKEGAKAVTTNKNKEGKSTGFDPMLRTEPAKRVIGNIFSDEPPPLDNDPYADTDDLFGDNDDDDDRALFSSKTSSKPNPSKTFQTAGLFGNKQSSNYGGLFDDLPDENDSDDFDSEPKKTQSKTTNSVAGKQMQPKNKHSGLFDASDEDIKPKAKTIGFFDDSDDEFFASDVPQSKKVDTKPAEVKNAPQSKKGLFDNNAEVKQQKNKGLFDDSADDFDSSFEVTNKAKNVAAKEVKPKANKGLFDDDDDDSDLFGGNAVSKVEETRKKVGGVLEDQKKGIKKPSLFGDDDSDDDGDLFASLKKKPAVVQSASKKQVIEQKVDKIEPQQQATNIFEETIDTEPEDLFAPMKMPPKKLPEIKKVIASNPPEDKAVKEAALPNKPPSAESMFGDNTNILQGPNSIASSILAQRRKGSSSSESDKDSFKETFEKVGKTPGSVQQTQKSQDTSEKKVNVVEKQKPLSKKTDAKGKPSDTQKKEQSLEVKKEEIFNKMDKKIEVKPKPEVKSKDEQKVKTVALISNVLDKPTKPIPNLFEDVDDDLFGAKKVAVEKVAPEKVLERSTSLFDDVPPPLDDEIPPPEGPRNVNSLFDYDDDEDLFSTIRNITKTSKSTVSSGLFDDLPAPVEEVRESKTSNVGLFFDEPPDLDDKDEPVGDSDLFSDYPYYKSVNIIKNNAVEKVVDQYFIGRRDSSTIEEVQKVTTQSDYEEKVVKNEQSHQKSIGDTKDYSESKTVSKKSSVFDELSDDDGDLFSSLAKPKSTKENASSKISGNVKEDLVPNFNQETEDKMLFEVRTDPSLKVTMDLSDKSKGMKDNLMSDVNKEEENKMLFEVRTDPSLKVTMDLSNKSKNNVNEDVFPNVNKEEENKLLFEVRADPSLKMSMALPDKSKVLNDNLEEVSAKPEETQSTPTLVKKPYIGSKPDIAKSKPEIKQTKPEISPLKPNIVSPKLKVGTTSDKSNDFDQKSNEGDSKTDVKQTKPEISNVKPTIETKKPEIVHVKPNIEIKKPDISSVKPNIEIKKPEIFNTKPKIENIKPKEHIESEESTKETKQDIVISKPEIISTKPGIIAPKPEHSSKMPDLKSDEQESVKDIKQDIVTSKPEINARKPEIVATKPGIISRKPEKSSKISEIPSPTSTEIHSAKSKSTMFDKFETKSSSTDSDTSSSDAFADDKNKPKLKPEIKQIKPVIAKEMLKESKSPIQKDVSTEKTIKTSISELVNKAENDSPKEIFREKAKIVPSSSIGDIKAALSKKSKSSLDMSEEIDGGSHSSMKNSSKSENASPTKTVGKLSQSSLNINVKALIPGAAPKLVKEINEERRGIESTIVSSETSKPDDINYERKDSDPGSLIEIEHKKNGSQPLNVSHSNALEAIKSVSFDEDPKSLDSVLSNSLSKDRVKIRAKRRPSTRKARLEAVRKSTADILSFDETDYADTEYTSSLPTSPFDKSMLDVKSATDKDSDFSSSLQSSFNDEDIIQTIGKVYRDRGVTKNGLSDSGKDVKKDFVSNVDDTLKEINKVEVKTKRADKTKKVDDLFNIFKAEKSEDDVGDDLFGNIISNAGITEPLKQVEKNVSEAKSKKSLGLFGEMDEDNDLFPSNANKKKNPTALFSDDSTEDLFSSLKPKETSVKTNKETPEIAKPKETIVKAKKDSMDSVKSQGAIRKITKTKNVFNDSDSDSDLFSSKSMAADQRVKPKTKGKSSDSRKQTDKSRNKLFGESDSEDELFFKPVTQGKAIGGNRDKTKSLFDDHEDGDIFKTDKGAVKKTVLPSSRTQAKTQNLVLSSAEIATQDPLSSFFN